MGSGGLLEYFSAYADCYYNVQVQYGNSRLLSQGLRKKVRKEVIACVYAAQEQQLLRLPKTGRKQVFDLLCTITYRMAGI